jgi:hypothetical protein
VLIHFPLSFIFFMAFQQRQTLTGHLAPPTHPPRLLLSYLFLLFLLFERRRFIISAHLQFLNCLGIFFEVPVFNFLTAPLSLYLMNLKNLRYSHKETTSA